MKKNPLLLLPNCMSFGRLFFIPVIIVLLQRNNPKDCLFAAGLFLLAGLSDILDGLLARKRHSITLLGAFLDPLADKVMSLSILIALIPQAHSPVWISIPIMLVLSREIAVAAMQGIASAQKIVLEPKRFHYPRKIFQFLALFCLLVRFSYYGINFQVCGQGMLLLATLFYMLSVLEYSIFFSRLALKESKKLGA